MTSRWSISVGLLVALAQAFAVALAAGITGSVALKTQTVTSIVDVVVGGFLLLGVIRSARPADGRHPLGYGREGFFWSFVAAAGIFVGGVGAAVSETVQALLHPQPAANYLVGYVVLAAVLLLELVGLVAALAVVVPRARQRRLSVAHYLWHSTDPALTTVCLSAVAGLLSGALALAGLAAREATGWHAVDTTASALIAVVLLLTSLLLLHASRELLTGRGVSPDVVRSMRLIVTQQSGIVAVPDIFAIVIGPGTLVVDGDVIFDDRLDVSQVEASLVRAADALRATWPSIAYVYLNPVAAHRERRWDAPPTPSPLLPAVDGHLDKHGAPAEPSSSPDPS
jgi:cation diffusion facilitator family transporter